MQLNIERDDLIGPLGNASSVVERRQTMPILSNLLLVAEDNTLTITATDLETEIVVRVPASVVQAGKAAVPARKLFDICRALPERTTIELKLKGEKVTLKSGRSRFTLATLPHGEFPAINSGEWQISVQIPQKDLKQLFENTQFCMAQQDVRYYLNGLLLEMRTNGIRAVATDGHRLAISDLEVAVSDGEKQVIVPRKGVHEMSRILENISEPATLQLGTHHIRLSMQDLVLTAKQIDGRFPDYNKVIPSAQSKQVALDRVKFLDALKRVAILTNEKYRGVRFNLSNDTLEVSAHNPEQEEAMEEVSVEYKGEEMEIGFNVSYIIDAASALGEEKILLSMSDPNSSCILKIVTDDSTRYVVMPMRL